MRENAFRSKINPEWNFTVIPTRNKKDLQKSTGLYVVMNGIEPSTQGFSVLCSTN